MVSMISIVILLNIIFTREGLLQRVEAFSNASFWPNIESIYTCITTAKALTKFCVGENYELTLS